MTDDLITRLRAGDQLHNEAADALEDKDQRIAELEAALKPFADKGPYSDDIPFDYQVMVDVGYLRIARKVL